MKRPVVILLGPSREALSGVSTHLNLLLASDTLAAGFSLAHFQVGSEGRAESAGARWLRLAASPLRLAAEILRRGAAVVHVNTSLDARAYWRDLAYVAVAKLCGARVVYQVHGGVLPADFFAGRMLMAWLRATLAWPDVVVVLASVEAQAYRAFVPRQSVALVPNGIDCGAWADPDRGRAARAARLSLLYIGRLIGTKGLFESLEALAAARTLGVEAELVVAGEGPEEARLRSRVHELDLAERVRFAGAAFGERKAQLLAAADVMLLPSYSEGLPYALLEAMAAGVVPVVTRVGAMPDVVAEGVHGLLVPPGDPGAIADAIAVLDRDRVQLARMSVACRSRVASAYSIGRVAADLAALYSGLCAARAPKAAL